MACKLCFQYYRAPEEAGNELLPPNILENAAYGKVIKIKSRAILGAIRERVEGTSRINRMAQFAVSERLVLSSSVSELGAGACRDGVWKLKIA